MATVWIWVEKLHQHEKLAPLIAVAITVPITYFFSRFIFKQKGTKQKNTLLQPKFLRLNKVLLIIKKTSPRISVSHTLVTFIVVLLILAPTFLNQLIPLHDYSHHLARTIILSDLENPVYSQFYKQGSLLLPNMAMEIIAVPLAHFVGAETASRIFVMLSLLSMLFGTMMLHIKGFLLGLC